MAKRFIIKHWKETAAALLLFIIALVVRLSYQKEAVVRNHIISDARYYFFGAYNLYHFGVYSNNAPPSDNKPPKPNSVVTPGYSFFQLPFLHFSKDIPQFLERVLAAQAVMGAFTAVLSFVLARFFLSLLWASIPGLLTALSPHLIAMDYYLLTESFFTFMTLAAAVMLVYSWGKKNPVTALLPGVLFGLSILIRPVSMLLGPFAALSYLLNRQKWEVSPFRTWTKQVFFFALGIVLTFGPYLLRNKISLERAFPESKLGWSSFVDGAYINLTYKEPRSYGYPYRYDPENSKMKADRDYFFKTLKKRFLANPWGYIKWYLGGKVLCSWRWDVITGHHDVYVYPMICLGFHTNRSLNKIHSGMKALHWPLVWMAFFAPVLLAILWRRKVLRPETVVLVPPFLIIAYHAILLTVMLPIPRYTIPLRPYCYLLAMASLYLLTSWIFVYVRPVFESPTAWKRDKKHRSKKTKRKRKASRGNP